MWSGVPLECLHWWLAMDGAGGVTSLVVVQQDQDREDQSGDIITAWQLGHEEAGAGDWMEGQVEMRAHTWQDVVQATSTD